MNTFLRRNLAAALLIAMGAVTATFGAPPQNVTITAPANNSTIGVSSPTPTVTISANATPSSGSATISSIQYLVNNVSIGSLTGPSSSISWTPSGPGTFTLTAIASDSSSATGNTLQSSPVTVTINPYRVATVTSPAANTTFAQNSQIFVRGTATMSDGIVANVEFFITDSSANTTSLGTTTSAPYNRSATLGFAPGAYTLTARATASDGVTTFTSASVPINIAAAVGSPPTVAITSPTSSDTIAASSNVTIFANASDPDGSITGVTFFADGEQIGSTDTTAPYSVTWTPTVVKTYTLTALATDNSANTRLSAGVNVNVLASAPTVSITSPANNSTGNVGVPQNVTATATPTAGTTIASVEFFANGVSIGTDTSSPFTVAWTPQNTGAILLTARATDSNNVAVTSSAITVNIGTTALPTVSVTAPAANATISTGAVVPVTASASASSGLSIASVQFFVNGVSIGTRTSTPYTVNWTPTTPGLAAITATATDSVGGVTNSTPVNVTVIAATGSLSVTLTPVGSTSIPTGSARAFTATTSPATGIAQVEFLLDGTVVATDTAAPFNFLLLAPNSIGSHSVTARVTDTTGQTATSAPVSIFITGIVGAPPTVGISTPTANAFLAPNTQTVIAGTASDPDGTITNVQVYANDTLVGNGNATLAGGNWSINWTTPATAGPVTIVAVATDNSGNSIAAVPVGVNIADTASPAITLAVSPVVAGQTAPSTTFPSGAVRNFVATVTPSVGRAVVRVEFFVDGTKVGEDTTAPYTFRYSAPALAPGETSRSFVLAARATDNAGAARDVQIPLLVVSPIGLPPTVNLLTPTNNSTVVPGVPIALAASAIANGGTIASVQFYVNGNPAGINNGNAVVTAPYTASFTPATPGIYAIDAIATDDRGNTTVSNTVTVTASFATPTVTFIAPNPSSTARATPNVPLTLTAAATAQGGGTSAVLLVEFLLDGVQIGARTTPTNASLGTYSFAWTPTAAQIGSHVLTARVTDTNSQSVTSAPINVVVATVTGTPPTITISTTPIPPQGLQTLSQVNFIANAFANGTGSTLTNVEFFLNEVSIGLAAREQTTNLYRLTYDFSRFDFSALTPVDVATPAPAGPRYQLPLYAIARDSNNNQTVSATATLNIYPSTSAPPSVQLQNVLGQGTITQGQQFLAGIISADSDGTVALIQLYANGVVVGQATNPLQGQIITYNANTAGRFNFFAVATDDTGNTVVSSPAIVLNVNAISTPVTTITRPSNDDTVTTVGAPVFLEGTASNPDTTQLPQVLFIATGSGGARTQIGGQRVGTTTTYRAIWTPTTPDTYTLSTQATVGQVSGTSSVTRRVVVTNLQGLAPTVAISVPGSATTASTINLTASATDSDGSVTEVEFFLNRNSIGLANRDPQGSTWRLTANIAGVPLGNAEVVALARDSSGNVAASATSNMNVTAASSIAPTISISLSTNNPAFNRQVQVRANARDSDGTVTNVTYFANNTNIGSSGNAGTSYQINWTPTLSGEFNIWAVATDNSGNTRVADNVRVLVRDNNPILEDAAFVLQTYQDIANTTNINPLVFDDLVARLGAGTLTRAELVADLVDENGFQSPVFTLATYYVLMGQQWPTPANYTTYLNSTRNFGGLANTINSILTSTEYVAKWGVTPTTQLLNNPSSQIPADTFILQIWRAAGLPGPEAIDNTRFRNNNVLSATVGRGYNVVGLQQALSEFITNTNSTNVALFNKARAAAIYYQLTRPPVTVTVDQLTAKIAALAEMKDSRGLLDYKAVADASLKDILYGYRYVTIRKQPTALVVAPRSGAIFSVEAEGAPPLAYQWLQNGAPIAGATSSILSLTNVDAGRVGSYSVAITSSAATATSLPVTLTLSTTPTKLANISTRGGTTGAGANVLIGGFVVTGTNAQQTRQVLIRVIGPTLGAAPFNVAGVLANPRLELYSGGNPNPVLTNDDWGNQAGGAAQVTAIQQATTRAGAFALPNNSLDAVALVTLPPGPYTVQAKSPANNPTATGVVLIEVYDVTPGAATPGKAANVSTRGSVGTGTNILIAGFNVSGTVHRRVLIRGAGPTLANFGVPGVLADPQLTLIDQSNGRTLATNDNWASGPDATIIAQASTAAGAFPFANNSRDSAIIIMLPPGTYTAQLSGVNAGTGVGIVEVYDVDP